MSGRRRYFLYSDLSTGLLAKNGMTYEKRQDTLQKGIRVDQPSLSLSVKQLDERNGEKTADALIDFANAL